MRRIIFPSTDTKFNFLSQLGMFVFRIYLFAAKSFHTFYLLVDSTNTHKFCDTQQPTVVCVANCLYAWCLFIYFEISKMSHLFAACPSSILMWGKWIENKVACQTIRTIEISDPKHNHDYIFDTKQMVRLPSVIE